MAARPETSSLAEAIGSMAVLSVEEQRLAVALYRQLARGEPVLAGSLATQLGADEEEVERTLKGWRCTSFSRPRMHSRGSVNIPRRSCSRSTRHSSSGG
jgi:hypothetical protein